MNKKYEKYIEYIVNDIKPPYFINMKDNYGLSEKEYSLVLSKIYDQPVTIKGISVYDTNGKVIYQEDSDGDWYKYKYNTNGNKIYYETSAGNWYKYEYDNQGNVIYYENSDGEIIDNRYE